MKILLKRIATGIVRYYEGAGGQPLRCILILGHMRSGSTLLNHILMSHPEVLGSGERNAYYDTAEDLIMLGIRTHYDRRQFLIPHRYVVDQINHNKFLRNTGLLNDPRVRTIFLIRRPQPSVTSMVRVLGRLYDTSLDQAVSYYVDRLRGLSHCALSLANSSRAAFTTYEDLVHDTSSTLANLTGFLGLQTGLLERYRKFDFTGKKGDPGPKIRLGHICRDAPIDTVDIPAPHLFQIEKAHSECYEVLKTHCVRASGKDARDKARGAYHTSRDHNESSKPPAASV